MRKQYWLAITLLVTTLAACASAYWWTRAHQQHSSVLAFLPRDPAAVLYIDIAALRQSPFLAQLAAWAPQPQKDPDYAQFVADTSFNFERDLDHVAIAAVESWRAFVIVGEGRFDRKKISAYAQRIGALKNRGGREIISLPYSVDTLGSELTFLSDRVVLLVTAAGLDKSLGAKENLDADKDWKERFDRLAGSPVFAVIRANRVPGYLGVPRSYSSPQLSSLLARLQWITIAAKPDADQLRLVAEGEAASESTSHQLADVLNSVVILAQTGLNDPKVRQQLNPLVRQAYLDLLKSADISKLDRGETKAVRLIVSVTPAFLEAARISLPLQAPQPLPSNPMPRKHPAASPRKSGT